MWQAIGFGVVYVAVLLRLGFWIEKKIQDWQLKNNINPYERDYPR